MGTPTIIFFMILSPQVAKISVHNRKGANFFLPPSLKIKIWPLVLVAEESGNKHETNKQYSLNIAYAFCSFSFFTFSSVTKYSFMPLQLLVLNIDNDDNAVYFIFIFFIINWKPLILNENSSNINFFSFPLLLLIVLCLKSHSEKKQ